MSAAEKIRHLKLVVGALEEVGPKQFWDAPGISTGVPRGVLVELLGQRKREWFLQFLKQNESLTVFWLEQMHQVLPTAIVQRGIDLQRITFAIVEKEITQPLRKVIQSGLFDVVVAPNLFTEIKIFKALQLFTEKANTTLFLMGGAEPSTAWPLSMQIEINQSGERFDQLRIEIIKQKYSKKMANEVLIDDKK